MDCETFKILLIMSILIGIVIIGGFIYHWIIDGLMDALIIMGIVIGMLIACSLLVISVFKIIEHSVSC